MYSVLQIASYKLQLVLISYVQACVATSFISFTKPLLIIWIIRAHGHTTLTTLKCHTAKYKCILRLHPNELNNQINESIK